MSNIFTTKEKTILGIGILGILVYLSVAVCFPLITIWAVNTLLFPAFSIPYSWSTYFAMLVVNWILMGSHVLSYANIAKKL